MTNYQVSDENVADTLPVKTNGNCTTKDFTQYLNYGEEDQMEIQGFVHNKLKSKMYLIFHILTLGILRLFFHWYPHLHIQATHSKSSLKVAEKVLVTDVYRKFKSYFVKEIKTIKVNRSGIPSDEQNNDKTQDNILECNLCDGRQKRLYEARVIRCKKLLYIWDEEYEYFAKLAGFDKGITRDELHSFSGQSKEKQVVKRIIYGNNEISVPVQTVLTLLALEALTPFYMFQLFSLIVWLSEAYYYYTIAIIVMSVVGISTSIIQTRRNQKNLRGTVNFVDTAQVCRGNNVYEQIPTTELVPGDLIVIPPGGCDMQCDAVLVSGTCVVNESMLTGESVPITKSPLPQDFRQFNLRENVSHTLFCGTKVIQTKNKGNDKVCAVVIRTGYLTTKGELVRSILYPPPADFKFETDSYKFIGILFLIAILGLIYTVVLKSTRKIQPLDILIKSLDLFTIAVPPALPAAMTVGKLYALNRLRKMQIFCINSRVINVSGSIDCVCFDKTGTLTEDELDVWGVIPIEGSKVLPSSQDVKSLNTILDLIKGMATCHSLSLINGQLGGDPLDIKMFESTGWSMKDNKSHNITVKQPPPRISNQVVPELEIVKQFQFSSHLQRMTVLVRSSDTGKYIVYCKGSPEMIMSLSEKSTVPNDFMAKVEEYTVQGYRVIALSRKLLTITNEKEVNDLLREQAECDLELCGVIVLENKIKPQTTGIINTLNKADFKVVMITGDNLQTGLHVAKECQLVQPNRNIIEVTAEEPTECHQATINYKVISKAVASIQQKNTDVEKHEMENYAFAVTGKSWGNIVKHFPELIPKIVKQGSIFARMSGIQKQQLVEELKNIGYYVAMCGDGANDCGALKAAHVGISLSEAESSVASPFTSKIQDISCVPKVIKEGRAALVTSFGIFKVMLCYSLIELTSVMILYSIDANLTAFEFLFIDIFLILNFASLFGITKAYDTLDKTPPQNSLMSFIPVVSMSVYMFWSTFFQLIGFYWIQTYRWFTPFVLNKNDDLNFISYENVGVYTVSMFQYITMCIVFSKGRPYRKPIYTNIYFTLSLLVTCAVCVWMTLIPPGWIKLVMEMKTIPIEAAYAMVIIAAINFVVCFVFEDFIIEYLLGKIIVPGLKSIRKSRKRQLTNSKNLDTNLNWSTFDNKEIVNLKHDFQRKMSNGIVNKSYVQTERYSVVEQY